MRSHGGRFTGFARVARGAFLGAAVLLITAAGHAAGSGGNMPEPAALVVLLPLFALLSATVADRRLSAAALLGWLVGMQALGHILLVVGFGHGGHAGGGTSLIPGPRMLLGHAIAMTVVLIVLIHGEDLLHRWLRFAADLTRTWEFALTPVRDSGRRSVTHDATPRLVSRVHSAIQRRGPPATR